MTKEDPVSLKQTSFLTSKTDLWNKNKQTSEVACPRQGVETSEVYLSVLFYSSVNFAFTRISLDELPTSTSNSPGSATHACLCGS